VDVVVEGRVRMDGGDGQRAKLVEMEMDGSNGMVNLGRLPQKSGGDASWDQAAFEGYGDEIQGYLHL
jgi:hypothetical protein